MSTPPPTPPLHLPRAAPHLFPSNPQQKRKTSTTTSNAQAVAYNATAKAHVSEVTALNKTRTELSDVRHRLNTERAVHAATRLERDAALYEAFAAKLNGEVAAMEAAYSNKYAAEQAASNSEATAYATKLEDQLVQLVIAHKDCAALRAENIRLNQMVLELKSERERAVPDT